MYCYYAVLHENMILQIEKEDIVLTEQARENLVSMIGKMAEILISYDISLMFEGVAVQPGGKVAVTVPAPENIGEYDSITIVFIDDNGNITPCETKVNDDGTVTFVTDHFSYYAIVGLPQNSVNTVMVVWFSVLLIISLAGGLTAFFIIKKKKEKEGAMETETELS